MEEKGAAADEVTDMKAKLTKLKRQALNFKNKLGEAVTARDTALSELRALKEVSKTLGDRHCHYSHRFCPGTAINPCNRE